MIISELTSGSDVRANMAGFAGRWPVVERTHINTVRTTRGHTRSAFLWLEGTGARSQGRSARQNNAMAPAVNPRLRNTVGLNPVHSIEKTSRGNFKYSINRRLGRTSYWLINVGVASSINTTSVIARTAQNAVSFFQADQL